MSARKEAIGNALRTLADPSIPYEHAPENPNCGECWLCIETTIWLAGVLRKDANRSLAPVDVGAPDPKAGE